MKELLKAALLIENLSHYFPEIQEILDNQELSDDEAVAKALLDEWQTTEAEIIYYSFPEASFFILSECAKVYLDLKDEQSAIKDLLGRAETSTGRHEPNLLFNILVTAAVRFINPNHCMLLGTYQAEILEDEVIKLKEELSDLRREKEEQEEKFSEESKKLREENARLCRELKAVAKGQDNSREPHKASFFPPINSTKAANNPATKIEPKR